MVEQPSGTVTLVFTDIEGSTRLLAELGRDAYQAALARHGRVIREAFAAGNGFEVDNEGDSFFYGFASAADAVAAVEEAMRELESGPIRVRVGVHTGAPGLDPPKYVGMDVPLAARVMAAAHGGQVLLSRPARELVEVEVVDLGEHRLKDIREPVWLYQLGGEEFPPPRTLTTAAARVIAPLGRELEVEQTLGFLAAVAHGTRGLLITGDAGIGKTTIWEAGVAAALSRGFRVMSCRAAGSELQLSFAGLGDLLDPQLERVLRGLPVPQRRALEATMGLGAFGAAPEPQLLGLALVNAFRALAAERPLVVAIDDLQWLDPPSGELLAFAFRRLQHEPVGLLAGLRSGDGAAAPFGLGRSLAGRLETLTVGPLAADVLPQLVQDRVETLLSRSQVRRIQAQSGGSPLYALELARALAERGEERLPASLRALVAERVDQLPGQSRALLVVLAAAAQPSLALVKALDAEEALAHAERHGVLIVDGIRLRFAHPLLAAAAYETATSAERRAAHRRLAALVDDPEQHARHLALAATGPDERIAAALDAASDAAFARGARGVAAELAEQGLELTPLHARGAMHVRRLTAARRRRTFGDSARARVLLQLALEDSPTEHDRAEPLWQLAALSWDEGDGATARALIREALERAEGDDRLCAAIQLDAVWPEGGYGGGLEPAQAALAYAERAGDPGLVATALSAVAHASFTHGLGFRRDLYERAVALERSAGFIEAARRPTTRYGLTAKWAGDIELSRELLERAAARALEDEDASYTVVLFYLAWLHLLTGEFKRALEVAESSRRAAADAAREGDVAAAVVTRSLIHAHLGRLEEAQADLELTRPLAEDDGSGSPSWYMVLWTWAALLVARTPASRDAAVAQLGRLVTSLQARGLEEPGSHPWFPTYVNALIDAGRLDEAAATTAWYEERAARLERRWALAMCAHLRGAIHAARGSGGPALGAFEQALELHEGVGRPFDRASTLLAYGQTLALAGKREAAFDVLGEALSEFDRLGATSWREATRLELDALDARRARATAVGSRDEEAPVGDDRSVSRGGHPTGQEER